MATPVVPVTPVTPKTGPGSTSFSVWLVGMVTGLLPLVQAAIKPGTPTHTAVFGAVGGIVLLGSTWAKLLHDKGIHIATIQAAGSDLAKELPGLRADLNSALGFAEADFPRLASVVNDLSGHVAKLEARVAPTALDVASIARQASDIVIARLTPGATPT